MDSNSPLILVTENEQTKISSFAKNMNNDLSVNEILHGNLERFFSSSTIQSNSEYQILLDRSLLTQYFPRLYNNTFQTIQINP